MADPNFAATMEMLAFAIDRYDEIEKVTSGSPGTLTRDEAFRNDLEGDWAQAARDAITNDRALLAQLLSGPNVLAALEPIIRQVGVAVDSDAIRAGQTPSARQLWADVFDYMHANSQSVNSRDFSFGSPSEGSNVGNGSVYRLTVDEHGYDLEGWQPDDYTLKCIADARTTAQLHREVFALRGTDAHPDSLKRTGTGLAELRIPSLNAKDSEAYVNNPSWNNYTASPAVGTPAQPTALPGWTPSGGDFTSLKVDIDDVYRAAPGDNNNASLKFEADKTITQNPLTQRAARWDLDTPYFVRVMVYRRDSCDGNFKLTLGGITRTVAMSGLTDDAWNEVLLVASPGANNWFRNLNENDLVVELELESRTTGSLNVDDLIVAPFNRVGAAGDSRRGRGAMGTYLVVVGGSTPWVEGDVFTFTDSVGGTRGVNQHWVVHTGVGYLPSENTGSETVADK